MKQILLFCILSTMAVSIHADAIHRAAQAGSSILVQEELGKGVSANERDEHGNTPLHLARNAGIADILIANRAKVNAKNSYGVTPLHLIPLKIALWEKRSTGLGALLLQNGARVNARDDEGNTPLHDAARFGRLEFIKVLLEHKANPNVKNNKGLTPLHAAVGLIATTPSEVERNAALGVTTAGIAATLGGVSFYLFSRAVILTKLAEYTKYKFPAASIETLRAARRSRFGTKLGLISLAALTAVASVVVSVKLLKRYRTMTALIDGGAKVNARDKEGNTPLHFMAAGMPFKLGERKLGVIAAHKLLQAGADRTARNHAGLMPYQVARKSYRFALAAILKPKKALEL